MQAPGNFDSVSDKCFIGEFTVYEPAAPGQGWWVAAAAVKIKGSYLSEGVVSGGGGRGLLACVGVVPKGFYLDPAVAVAALFLFWQCLL